MPETRASHQAGLTGFSRNSAHHPPHADEQVQEPEHVRQPGERPGGIDEAEDGGDAEQDGEDDRRHARGPGQARDGDVLHAGEGEHQPDEDADGGDGGVVELEDHQRRRRARRSRRRATPTSSR